MVGEPARGADDDVSAAFQFRELTVIRRAAIDRHRIHAPTEGREFVNLVGHLRGQFTRGGEDQHLRGLDRGIDLLDGRDAEGRRLPRARLGLADHVAARHDQRDGRRLDRRGFLEAELRNGLENFSGKAQ